MSSADKLEYDEGQLLTRYLLGALTEKEAEPLDERSIVDEEFALRLDAAEHDLVDAFVRGELFGDARTRFEHFYLSSPRRVEKVEFAKALLRLEEKSASHGEENSRAKAGLKDEQRVSNRFPSRWFAAPKRELQWAFAAVALATLFAAGYLFVLNRRLQNEMVGARTARTTLDQQNRELQRQVQDERAVNAQMSRELETLRQSQTGVDQFKAVAAVLMPPSRGAGRTETVSLAHDTTLVVLFVRLESDDFPLYDVELKAAGTDQIVWHRENLKAEASSPNKDLSVSLAAHLLKQQFYELQVAGVPSQGRAELLSDYLFKVVIK